jgi:lambda family phage portal protein
MTAVTISCPVYAAPAAPRPAPERRSGYDIARTTHDNRKHWADADGLTPAAQLTPAVRKRLRDRCRHEVLNNTFAAGAVRTLVNDTVGRGPRLQVLSDDDRLNAAVEALWREWSGAADWPLTCRLAVGVEVVAGETFGIPRESKRLERLGLPVTLHVPLFEPDQVSHGADSNWLYRNEKGDDGVVCDRDGEVVTYKVLKSHPGDSRSMSAPWDTTDVPAEDVLHFLQPTRPGQLRGITPFTPALPLFAQLRRFTSATLTAAEVAAMLAGVLETDLPPGEPYAGVNAEDAFDTIELVRGTLLTLPSGYKASQFKPEQPTTGYEAFVSAKLKEIGRAVNMPFGKLAGDHSAYNYSSGRLDHEAYWADRDIARQAFESKFVSPFLRKWLEFARFEIPQLAAYKRGRLWRLPVSWQYDPRPTSDPVKDATGDELNLTNGTDTLSDIAAREGVTVEELIGKRARDVRLWRAAGLPPTPWMVGASAPARPGDGVPQNPADAKSEVAA